jgi:hypothetical protein
MSADNYVNISKIPEILGVAHIDMAIFIGHNMYKSRVIG